MNSDPTPRYVLSIHIVMNTACLAQDLAVRKLLDKLLYLVLF